ncbi:hypothetical protein ACFPL7_17800 [Dongia soli]|uniref:Pyroglutamyl-peptidase I n=1 Tax=Dongia soli TaxID=600628 RepID=A0ABU5E5A5_9PROT|nr:hypothetical protein [Dongia soli]MDY0881446.1 hypothetical protein [Dongia soli]
MSRTVLLTGFEPFGGLTFNPALEIAKALHGAGIDDLRIHSEILPVTFEGHAARLEKSIRETAPVLVLSLGLYGGEDMIRLERIGLNLADFDLADNAGLKLRSSPIEPSGPAARIATLPCDAIQRALLASGIPARLSNTAGAYLCNATLYSALRICADQSQKPRCGFIHLPYATQQVAAMLIEEKPDELTLISPDSILPSLPLDLMIEAVKIAIRTGLTAQ